MKVLTVYRPTDAVREFFQWDVGGELLVVPGVCPWRESTTLVLVSDLDVREDDVVAACRNTFEGSGHDDDTFGEPLESIVREVASDAIEAASEHPVGTLLRLLQKFVDGGIGQYVLEPVESGER